VKNWLKSKNPECYVVTNPGQEKNLGVKRDNRLVYPDVLYGPDENTITRLYEVETEDSVNEEEVEQWREFNAGPSSFYLVVPENYVEAARRLIRNAGFSIDGFYYYDSNLNIHSA